MRRYLIAERERTSAASADVQFRNLRVFFNWLIKDGERTLASPVDPDDWPKVANKAYPQLSDAELKKLLKACAGNSFADRRDLAIMRIFLDNGMRVSGMAGLRYTPDVPQTNDVDLAGRRLRIVLKGGNELVVPIGAKTAAAIDRYLRVRAAHPQARTSPWL